MNNKQNRNTVVCVENELGCNSNKEMYNENGLTRKSKDTTHPLYWLVFAVCYIAVASISVNAYFKGDADLYAKLGFLSVGLFPAGLIINKLLKAMGCWKNRECSNGRLGELLYAPALLLPMAIIGVPVYHFAHFPILLTFVATTGVVVAIVLLVDTCLNLLREKFVMMFQAMYKYVYKFVYGFLIKKVFVGVVVNRVVKPMLRALWKALVWMGNQLRKFYNKVIVPAISKVWRGIKAACRFTFDKIIKPLGRFFVKTSCVIFDKIIEPICRVVKMMVVKIDGVARRAVKWIFGRILFPVIYLGIIFCEKMRDNVLKPMLQFIRRILSAIYNVLVMGFCLLMTKILKKVASVLVKVSEFIYNKIMVPVADAFKKAMKFLARRVFVPLYNKIVKLMGWVYSKILTPLYNAMLRVMKCIYKYVLTPVYKALVWIAKVIYNYFLKYVFHIISMQYIFVTKQLKIVYSWVFNDANGVVNYFITIPLIILVVGGIVVFQLFF